MCANFNAIVCVCVCVCYTVQLETLLAVFPDADMAQLRKAIRENATIEAAVDWMFASMG